MTFIKIKASEEDTDPIWFPIPPAEEITLSDLRSAFPTATSLRYRDEENGRCHHVLCRNETFVQPAGGWFKENRIYIVVTGVPRTDTSTARFDRFQAFRQQMHRRPIGVDSITHVASSSRTSTLPIHIRVGHGQFKNSKFSKISSSSACGGLVVVGPYSRNDNNKNQIKDDAYSKFCSLNRLFRQKYKSSDNFVLVYPDGTPVNALPDESAEFSKDGYRKFLDPKMKFDRLRLYLCEKSNFYMNNEEIEIVSESSSDDDLPDLFSDKDKTLSFHKENDPVITITFKINDNVFVQSFPHNTRSEALFDFISGLPNMTSPFLLNYKQSIIQHNHRLLEIFGSDTNTADVEVIENETENCVESVVNETLKEVKDIEEPTELLTRYSRKFLIGRPLDLQDPGGYLEGETNEIFVGRNSIFIDGSNEILAIQNVRYPLNVTFYGEEAEDLGGPRREFFELYINYFKENVLDTDENSVKLKKITSVLVQRHYWAAGIISGLSAIQGGPCPTFLMGIVESTDTSECYTQFRQGLDQTGLLTFIQKKPTLGYLFTPSNRVTLTVARLLGMLKPNFSDAGSNDRMHQEESYSHFVKYVREVAAGRRNISLPDILRFCTGLTSEPVLGFSIQPTVDFIELPGNLPSASTCINVLNLPVNTGMEQKALFEKFDLAFSNQYFGLC